MAETKKPATKKATPKTEQSVEEQLVAARKDLWAARKSHASGELVNPRILGAYRKNIARIKTAMSIEAKENKL